LPITGKGNKNGSNTHAVEWWVLPHYKPWGNFYQCEIVFLAIRSPFQPFLDFQYRVIEFQTHRFPIQSHWFPNPQSLISKRGWLNFYLYIYIYFGKKNFKNKKYYFNIFLNKKYLRFQKTARILQMMLVQPNRKRWFLKDTCQLACYIISQRWRRDYCRRSTDNGAAIGSSTLAKLKTQKFRLTSS